MTRRITLRIFSCVVALGLGVACLAEMRAEGARPQVLYLHTEFLPYAQGNDKDLSNRLSREVIRQAMLVAARDGLGLQTCDESLQETPPANAEVVHAIVTERATRGGKWRVKLSRFIPDEGIDTSEAVWETTYDVPASSGKFYSEIIPKLEADSRGSFIEALKKVGLRAEKTTSGKQADLTKEQFSEFLLIPDFIAQFGVVRAAHRAIVAHGETPEMLGALTRGYANLASLTNHQWHTGTEVFTARAWLYGQRMVASKEDRLTLTHRAYAWAVAGDPKDALADLERIEKTAGAATSEDSKDVSWAKLVKPFANCNRAETKKGGDDQPELKPWSAYLYFELANYARYPEWMHEAVGISGGVCPTAYKTFDELAHHGGYLGVTRMGAAVAPKAFGHFVPLSLGKLPGLPAEIRDVLPSDADKTAALEKLVNDPNSEDDFSAAPVFFAAKLREHSRQQAEGDLSWSVLATLIDEEQFVEAANYLEVATNATEVPLQGLVDSLLPLVKNHRFANYVESFALGSVRDPQRLFSYFGEMAVHDPRQNMYPMFSRIGYLKTPQGEPIGPGLIASCTRNFTLPGIVEFLFPIGPGAMQIDGQLMRTCAHEASEIAPGCPVGTRLVVQLTPSAKPEDTVAWEKSASDDSITLMALAKQYLNRGEKDSATRCWEKSLAALPSAQGAIDLANFYRTEGNVQKWQETLDGFLKTEDLGLQHMLVEECLAGGFMRDGNWQKAKPYALAAAQTYSNGGLAMGSFVTEGLAEWELSEKLIQADSMGYPSRVGAEWYFWCRRTGRGHVKAAKELAEQYFALPQPHPTDSLYMQRATYAILNGDLAGGRDSFQEALKIKRTFTCTCVVAQLARELKDEQLRTEVIAAMEKEMANPSDGEPRKPKVDKVGGLLLDLLKNGNPSKERLASIDDALLQMDKADRMSTVGFCYIVGAELDALGQQDEAKKYLRRALIDPSRHAIVAILAGAKLAGGHGTSRPDDDALDADDLWPPKDK